MTSFMNVPLYTWKYNLTDEVSLLPSNIVFQWSVSTFNNCQLIPIFLHHNTAAIFQRSLLIWNCFQQTKLFVKIWRKWISIFFVIMWRCHIWTVGLRIDVQMTGDLHRRFNVVYRRWRRCDVINDNISSTEFAVRCCVGCPFSLMRKRELTKPVVPYNGHT